MAPSNLCDVCRQNAAAHFFIDVDHPTGMVNRQLCSRCQMLTPGQRSAMVSIDLMAHGEGKCQFCGGPVQVMSGVPGPDRRITCNDCHDKH